MKPTRLIALGLAVFLFAGLLNLPAARLQRWVLPENAALRAQGLTGTLAQGRAAQIEYQGQPLIRELSWQLQHGQLLLGRAGFRLNGGTQGVLIDGHAALLPSGTLKLAELRLTAPLAHLMRLAGQGLLPVEGVLAADIEQLRVRDQWPDQAQGVLRARGLGWKLGREAVLLGDYDALIENETAGIKLSVSTVGGPLVISGVARLGHDRSYEVDLQLRPLPDAPPLLNNLVKNLGQPDSQGWYHLRRRGQQPMPAVAEPIAADTPEPP